MRYIIFAATFFVTAFAFAQQTGTVSGQLLDVESNNAPLRYAKVSIVETGAEVLTDEEGLFSFKNLKTGRYTLVSRFVGYEAKKHDIDIVAGRPTTVTLHLKADSISVEDIMQTLASADKKETASNNK